MPGQSSARPRRPETELGSPYEKPDPRRRSEVKSPPRHKRHPISQASPIPEPAWPRSQSLGLIGTRLHDHLQLGLGTGKERES